MSERDRLWLGGIERVAAVRELPWPRANDALLGTMPDAALAKLLHRSSAAVTRRRHELKIRAFRLQGRAAKWGATELAMLGRYPDEELANITGRTIEEVQAKRLAQ